MWGSLEAKIWWLQRILLLRRRALPSNSGDRQELLLKLIELQIMPALEAKIQELRSLGLRHFNHLDWFRTNWKHTFRLPPLFAEIFDIPNICEEDLQ